MVLKLDGAFYYGDACLNRLALLSTRSGAFNRLTAWSFSNPSLARLAYPVLRGGRNLALWLLGRGRLREADVGRPGGAVRQRAGGERQCLK
ncbi:MAG: hypothetical protein JNL61_20015 [Rhizobiaceae bacterium]|nr:hypothetical protein [Rhizobiaceae bacterium]